MNKIILVGKTASGKTYAKNLLVDRCGLKPEVSYTTRKRRVKQKEQEGVDYFFVTRKKFQDMITGNEFIQWDEYKGQLYGTSIKQFPECEVMIMTPNGIRNLPQHLRKQATVILVTTPDFVIKKRLDEREMDKVDIEARMVEDTKQFETFTDYDSILDGTLPFDSILEYFYDKFDIKVPQQAQR